MSFSRFLPSNKTVAALFFGALLAADALHALPIDLQWKGESGEPGTAFLSQPLEWEKLKSVELDTANVDLIALPATDQKMILKCQCIAAMPGLTNEDFDFLHLEEKDGALTVKLNYGKKRVFTTVKSITNPKITLMVPAGFEGKIVLKTNSGDLTAENLPGKIKEIEASSLSGDLTLEKLSSPVVRASSSSGSMVVTGIAGESLEAKTSSGDVSIAGIEAKSVVVQSASGDIQLHSPYHALDSQIRSASGDVEVNGLLGPGNGSAINVSLQTSSGEFSVDDQSSIAVSSKTKNAMDFSNAAAKDSSATSPIDRFSVQTSSGDIAFF